MSIFVSRRKRRSWRSRGPIIIVPAGPVAIAGQPAGDLRDQGFGDRLGDELAALSARLKNPAVLRCCVCGDYGDAGDRGFSRSPDGVPICGRCAGARSGPAPVIVCQYCGRPLSQCRGHIISGAFG